MEQQLTELSIRPSTKQPGKTVILKKIMSVDESQHPGMEVVNALTFKRRQALQMKSLIAMQVDVDVDNVAKLLRVSRLDPIEVMEKGGKFYILNGHHRFVVAFLRGEKTVQSLVIKFAS